MVNESSATLNQLLVLGLAWALWAGVHSLLLQRRVRGRLEAVLGLRMAVYRLLYSLFSLVTVLPVVMYIWWLGGIWPFFWPGPWLYLQALLLALGLGLLEWAEHSFRQGGQDLFGWQEAAGGHDKTPALVASGAYAHLRHPMHVAGLILIWSRSLGPADLVTNLVLSAYLILGTWHEERRLRRFFGPAYHEYARRVGLLPGGLGRDSA